MGPKNSSGIGMETPGCLNFGQLKENVLAIPKKDVGPYSTPRSLSPLNPPHGSQEKHTKRHHSLIGRLARGCDCFPVNPSFVNGQNTPCTALQGFWAHSPATRGCGWNRAGCGGCRTQRPSAPSGRSFRGRFPVGCEQNASTSP